MGIAFAVMFLIITRWFNARFPNNTDIKVFFYTACGISLIIVIGAIIRLLEL